MAGKTDGQAKPESREAGREGRRAGHDAARSHAAVVRLGGVAAGAAGAGVGSASTAAALFRAGRAGAPRSSRGRRCAVAANDRCSRCRAACARGEGARKSRRDEPVRQPQDVVVLKPNIAWDRTPEQAANTNPELVAEVVRQCWQAGAQARDRHRRELQRAAPLLSAFRHSGGGARRGRRGHSARSRAFPRGGHGRRGAEELARLHAVSRSRQDLQPAHRQAS